MHARTWCFVGGVVLLQRVESLPDLAFAQFLPMAMGLCLVATRFRLLGAVAAGFLWALIHAHFQLSGRLPDHLEGRDLLVEGRVVTLVEARPGSLRFGFEIERITGPETYTGRVRLNWYDDAPAVRAGQRWRLPVRLKAPRGFSNPGGFDYEGWLYRGGFDATGYVRSGVAQRIGEPTHTIAGVRQMLSEGIERRLRGANFVGVVKALAVGDRSGLTDAQWTVFRRTGTSHLMAISGLHIGLIAGGAFFVIRFAAQLGIPVAIRASVWPPATAAVLGALGYAALAGFAVPTQRALIMIAVVMVSLAFSRHLRPVTGLSRAALAVVLLDPPVVGSPGFWLSFLAVASIFFALGARVAPRTGKAARWWWRFLRVQWFLGIALAPVTLLYYQNHAEH